MQHPINLMLCQDSSIKALSDLLNSWLRKSLDYDLVMLTISDKEIPSKINECTLHTLPAVVKDLCRSHVGLRSSILRCYVWTASVLEVFSRKAQDWHNQPKAFQGKVKQPTQSTVSTVSTVSKNQHQAKIVMNVVTTELYAWIYRNAFTHMLFMMS